MIATLGGPGAVLLLLFPQDPEQELKKNIKEWCRQLDDADASVRGQAIRQLLESGDEARKAAVSTARRLLSKWLREYESARRRAHSDIRSKRDLAKCERLRTEARDLLKQKKPDQMKPLVEELLKIFFPDPSQADGDAAVQEAVRRAGEVAGWLSRLGEKPEDPAEKIREIARKLDEQFLYTLVPAQDAAILQRNAQLAKQIEPQEYDFVVILNKYRIAMGVNAAEIDVKLCRACRGHSQDMKEKGFFSHESPVPGKRTFGMRAAREGTSAASENISRAGPRGEDAFWSWFSSTAGHHENMLARWRRVGIGNFAEMWTANFG